MRGVQVHNGTFFVLERGDELITSLTRYCEEHEIHWAQFQAIGAVEDVEIGYYDLATREYVFRQEEGPFEVASMDGNIAELNGVPMVHAHAVLSRADETLETIGGHIKSAIVHLTLELCMWEITQPLIREPDEDTGLDLIQFEV
jgi:predicted DNA-binding protein with PD1-like motif